MVRGAGHADGEAGSKGVQRTSVSGEASVLKSRNSRVNDDQGQQSDDQETE